MTRFIVILSCLLSFLCSTAQNIKVNTKDSHKDFVKTLTNSKEDRYNAILSKYDAYIKSHPDDINVQIYKCKFIGSAYYDDYEDYNLKYDETLECVENLASQYPNNPKILLYKLDYTYGEEVEPLLLKTLDLYKSNTINWDNEDTSALFEISSNYYTEDDDYKAIDYADLAEQFNDTLDLSVLKTDAYLRLENKDKARESILKNLDAVQPDWVLDTKGQLLISLDEDDEALKLYDRIKANDSTYSINESLYKIFELKEDYSQARTYLVNDTITAWNKASSIQKLANHDLKYSDAEAGIRSLRRMYKESYYDDFFGIKRLRLAFKAPTYYWSFGEISHIFVLLLSILILMAIPYLWILPIYSLSNYFNFKKVKEAVRLPGDWSLRHFWLISFLYMLTLFILILVFNYQEELNYYFDIVGYFDEFTEETDLVSANAQLLFSALLLLFTVILLNKKRLQFVFRTNNSIRQMIGLSIIFLIFNGFIIRIIGTFVDLSDTAELISSLSAKEDIQSLLNEYGFYITILVVAIIVPFYEEIIFRGIIFTSTEKHLGYKVANVLQASLFALAHFNLSLFIFYFVFGLVTGYFVKRSRGLATGIVFHIVNNFVVTVTLLAGY
ncbi:CPBP family intramembrane glutamic endopeptidase [uncultured Lacinutrix sp.]|uniref:CPBP family intramembrane glutamic endopeptidase n=1 Tax=uncultured Lacinutrix sp. TaxID=574032 RepID=UPI002603EBAD|nr:CPBP family intramembrane glutamic endopeptidase [uncultured Lacinutrix sp.]